MTRSMKVWIPGLLLLVASAAWGGTRSPAVAGAFYTADPVALRGEVERLLAAFPAEGDPAVALVVPHAGYAYSGATAAQGFAAFRGADVRRVLLLGPSHHVGFAGAALPGRGVDAFSTPLGKVMVDVEAVEQLRSSEGFDGPSRAHDPEHSLEVELPFLQVVAPDASIVPVLLGAQTDRSTARSLARGLAPLLGPGTVVVVSSDFTHHGAAYRWAPFGAGPDLGDTLLELGRATADRAAGIDADGFWQQVKVSGDTVCGARPILVLLELLDHAFDGEGELAALTTSGHVSGDWSRSVTYATVAFHGSWRAWREKPAAPALETLSEAQGRQLLALARATFETYLEHGPSLATWFADNAPSGQLTAKAGAFVTVNNRGEKARRLGRLRACMGNMGAVNPLVETVVETAISAAHDPRFPALEADELALVSLEVSVLSPRRRVSGPEEVELGRHGVVLSKGRRSAVYLPQVATETGWDLPTFLSRLSRKAGLPPDAWKEGATLEVFTAQVFSEDDDNDDLEVDHRPAT